MADLKLPKLPDRTPIKIAISVMPDLFEQLNAYTEIYEVTYGKRESVADLIPFMLRAFLESLPAGQVTISGLLDFVEDELYESECNHSLQHAMKFMMDNGLDFGKVTSWLNNNGGYCDCKVMEQIAPVWRSKFGDD